MAGATAPAKHSCIQYTYTVIIFAALVSAAFLSDICKIFALAGISVDGEYLYVSI
jgi:hypothetical protein